MVWHYMAVWEKMEVGSWEGEMVWRAASRILLGWKRQDVSQHARVHQVCDEEKEDALTWWYESLIFTSSSSRTRATRFALGASRWRLDVHTFDEFV